MGTRVSKDYKVSLTSADELKKINTVEFEKLRYKLNKLMGEVYDGHQNKEILLISQKLDKMMNKIYYKSNEEN